MHCSKKSKLKLQLTNFFLSLNNMTALVKQVLVLRKYIDF